MSKRAVRISAKDNVATALADLAVGDTVVVVERDGSSLTLVVAQPVPFAHKLALAPIGRGEDVIKYGASIGAATAAIGKGEYVHTHNLASQRAKPGGSQND